MGKSSNKKANKNFQTSNKYVAQREAQEAKDRRRRLFIILGIVAVLVVVIAVVAGMMAGKKSSSTSSASGEFPAGIQAPGYLPNAIVIGPDGLGSAKEGIPTVNRYFSYGCPGCLHEEHLMGKDLHKAVEDGKFNMVLYPVGTHGLPWTYSADDAALKVAKEAPDKFYAFHEKLIDFAFGVMNKDEEAIQAQGNGTVLADEQGALKEIKRIGKEVGLSQNLIDSFVPAQKAKAEVDGWTNDWVSAVQPIVGDQVGTPMSIKNTDKKVSISDYYKLSEEDNKRLTELQKSDPKAAAKEIERINKESIAAYIKALAE